MELRIETLDVGDIAIEFTRAGKGKRLLFLHGGLGIDGSLPFLQLLAEHYEVLAPSHPGFGNSAWPQHIRSVSDLAFFYLDLADQLELEETVLVGSCFGGWVAAEILIRSTSRFSHAVLIDPLGAKFGDRLSRDITDIHSLSESDANQHLFSDQANALTDYAELSDEVLTRIARNREAFTYFGWKPYMYHPSLRHWLHRIDIPAMLLWGSNDTFVSSTYGKQYAAAIPSADLRVISDAGHFPHIENAPAVLEHLMNFATAR